MTVVLSKTSVVVLAGIWIVLAGFEISSGRPASIMWGSGSYILTLAAVLVLCVILGLGARSFAWALTAGLAATTLSGPLLAATQSAPASYAIAAALAGLAILSVSNSPLIPLAATAAHLWSLTALARLQLGLGEALVDAEPGVFLPALWVWTAATIMSASRMHRSG